MSKKLKKHGKQTPGFKHIKSVQGVHEYKLKSNQLTVLFNRRPGTGVVTSNITYRVGARDEAVGESGLAHMLEHMLFKPTKQNLKDKIDSGAMQFERETGSILNANTWSDRTTYYFSYPTDYFERAISIEADRMENVVISDKEFQPERGNVLSEFDMYFGDPYFALETSMIASAFQSHPYGHQTIGFREDIEAYTVEKLQTFYRKYYQPNNAVLTISGDIEIDTALKLVKKYFGGISNSQGSILKEYPKEPRQEGTRRIIVQRQSDLNIVAIGFKHAGFPTPDWFKASVLLTILTGGPDSILHRAMIDTGLASQINCEISPASDPNLGIIYVTLAKGQKLAAIEEKVLQTIEKLSASDIKKPLNKALQQSLTEEAVGRSSSLGFAMEMTEYVSLDDWTAFFDTEKIIASLTVKDILQTKKLFVENNLTIGHFVGKN